VRALESPHLAAGDATAVAPADDEGSDTVEFGHEPAPGADFYVLLYEGRAVKYTAS